MRMSQANAAIDGDRTSIESRGSLLSSLFGDTLPLPCPDSGTGGWLMDSLHTEHLVGINKGHNGRSGYTINSRRLELSKLRYTSFIQRRRYQLPPELRFMCSSRTSHSWHSCGLACSLIKTHSLSQLLLPPTPSLSSESRLCLFLDAARL
jgi:hypothetical protein